MSCDGVGYCIPRYIEATCVPSDAAPILTCSTVHFYCSHFNWRFSRFSFYLFPAQSPLVFASFLFRSLPLFFSAVSTGPIGLESLWRGNKDEESKHVSVSKPLPDTSGGKTGNKDHHWSGFCCVRAKNSAVVGLFSFWALLAGCLEWMGTTFGIVGFPFSSRQEESG